MESYRDEFDDYFVCSHCGAEVPAHAHACRECGASDDAGWDNDDDGEYAEEDFDYDEFVRREFPAHAATPARPLTLGRAFNVTVVTAVILAMLWLMFGWTCRG